MKITYVVEWDAFHYSGVARKVNAQVKAWEEMSHSVQLVIISPKPNNHILQNVFVCSNQTVELHFSGGLIGKVAKAIAIQKAKVSINLFQPDVIYYRQSSWTPGIISLLKKAKTIVVEINSDDILEVSLSGVIRSKLYALTRSWLIKVASGFVCVTQEIANLYSSFGCPVSVIANGFDLTSVEPRVPTDDAPIKAVFVGSDALTWHGVDKIITLAKLLPEIEFHIVGIDIKEKNNPRNIIDHGYMSWSDLAELYKRMDLGFGTLALYRKGMSEACPLKCREYLAYGLPVIGGYKDTDLSGAEFYLEIDNTPTGAVEARNKIVEFANKWKNKSIDRRKVEALIGTKMKEKNRLEFIKILSSSK